MFTRRRLRIAEIRHGRKAAGSMHAEPCAAGLQVAPGDDVSGIGPPVGALCRTPMEFVAVRGDE